MSTSQTQIIIIIIIIIILLLLLLLLSQSNHHKRKVLLHDTVVWDVDKVVVWNKNQYNILSNIHT